MFSEKDIEVFADKIDDLEESADKLTKQINKQLIKDQKEIIKIIEKYIKSNELIIYGGNAQNMAVMLIDKKNAFYDKEDVHDYDVYSYDPIYHIEKLTKQIYDAGFKNILATEAIHVETYSIKYYGTALCDFSYMPKYIFYKLPTLTYNNFKIIDPYFAYIDFMRMFNDPLTSSSFRWAKNFERFNLMQQYYPLKAKELKKISTTKDDINNTVKKVLLKTNVIFTGFKVFNKYASLSKCNKINYKYYTVVSSDYVNDVNTIIKKLKKVYKDRLVVQERYPFFQFWDFSCDIRIDDKIICKIYKNNNICIPYKTINKCKYASFTYNLMWMMIEKVYYSLYNNECNDVPENSKEIKAYYDSVISAMLFMKDKYLKDNKKTFLDDTPFQHFVVSNCSGIPLNPSDIKQMIKNYRGFKYVPSTHDIDDTQHIYTNISGRFITSDNNKFFK